MFEQIYGWIQNITVYLIVTAAILHAVPGKDYGKYIRFFSGLILILLLATPVLSLTDMRGRFEELYRSSEYELEKQEIEKVEEIYRNSGLSDYFPTEENGNEPGNMTEADGEYGTGRINVGEIEIGQE